MALMTGLRRGLALLVLGAGAFGADEVEVYHQRVIWGEDPAHAATISWTTNLATESNVVHLELPGEAGAVVLRDVASAYDGEFGRGKEEQELAPEYFHHARVLGLKPDSEVGFTIESDGVKSRRLHFRTATEGDQPYRLIAGGDSRTGHRTRRLMNELIASLVEKDPGIQAFDHGGDYVYDGREWKLWTQWLSEHELTTTKAGRVLPIIPTRGNHDWGILYDQVFDTPGHQGANWFVTQLGLGLSLVTLNTNVSLAGEQREWLAKQLGTLRSKSRWLMASYHRPAFPAKKEAGPALQAWVPLFEKWNVDLVLESDGHVMKRTVPMRGGKLDPTGVVYVGEGGLGAPQRVPLNDAWYLEAPGFVGRGAHVIVLSVGEEAIKGEIMGYAVDPESGRIPEVVGDVVTFDSFVVAIRP